MNVQQVIDAIIKESDVQFKFERTCDILMSGTPDLEVTGIITSFMATVDVIKEAIACGANMIITHEPTYFTGRDETDWLLQDPIYWAKKKLIDDHNIAIWRYHDHMHAGKSDRIYDGLLKELGWGNKGIGQHTYKVEETSLKELASFFKEKLQMDVIQVVGKPDMKCSRVGVLVGGGSLGLGREEMPMQLMHDQELDVMVCGEITEWTLCAYINDAQMLGFNKAMIVVGHERSEEWGMKHMAQWLKPLVGDIPVSFIDAREPFSYL